MDLNKIIVRYSELKDKTVGGEPVLTLTKAAGVVTLSVRRFDEPTGEELSPYQHEISSKSVQQYSVKIQNDKSNHSIAKQNSEAAESECDDILTQLAIMLDDIQAL